MAVCSFLSCDNLSFKETAASYSVAAVVNGAGPPSANDMLPLLCSALFIPLVQPLREVDSTPDLKVDIVGIRLVCATVIKISLLETPGLSSPLISKV